MYNLRNFNGTFKGNIAECMFKLTRKNLFLTRFHAQWRVLNAISRYLENSQICFLRHYWFSIDSIEIENFMPVLYEIKAKNRYRKSCFEKPKLTFSTVRLYKKALSLGFKVRLTNVVFHENWNYAIDIKDFSESNFIVDGKRKYDKT